jgi:hypothetical protein
MKKIFALAILLSFGIQAQNSASKADDMGRLGLSTMLSEKYNSDMTDAAKNMLANKLSQIATQNGMGGNGANPRFIISANVIQLSKEVTATAPPMVAMNLEVTLYIGDYQTKTKYASVSVPVKGVGTNDTKAYIEALKNLNPQNPNIRQFVDQGKTKIIEYYNSQCDFILKDAQALANQNRYQEAIYKLTTIPDVCKSCYDKAMDAITPVYKKFMEKNCIMLLADAKSAFAANPNSAGAEKVRYSLSQIDPDAACFKDAQVFSDSVRAKVLRDEKRDWDFAMKVFDTATEIEKQRIQAYKEVGVAFGNNQPKQTTTNTFVDPKDWLF